MHILRLSETVNGIIISKSADFASIFYYIFAYCKISYNMCGKKNNLQFIIMLSVILIATVIIIVGAVSCSGGKITFEETFFFVCYKKSDNAISAGSLSETASNLGGAGYILKYNEKYYVTLSCYYEEDEANDICAALKQRELECFVLKIETKEFKLYGNSKQNKELFKGNLKTFSSLSHLAYECANGIDTGAYSQNKAKSILANISDTLDGMLKSNGNNCFTEKIKSVIDECGKVSGYLYSKNMRYIQIALADVIINAEFN